MEGGGPRGDYRFEKDCFCEKRGGFFFCLILGVGVFAHLGEKFFFKKFWEDFNIDWAVGGFFFYCGRGGFYPTKGPKNFEKAFILGQSSYFLKKRGRKVFFNHLGFFFGEGRRWCF